MDRWAKLVTRRRWAWIVCWIGAGLVVWIPAPRVPTLLADDATSFLPAELPSQQALTILRAEFPQHAPASRAVVLCVRDTGLTSDDRTFIADVSTALASRSEELGWRVNSVATAAYLSPLLDSAGGRASIISIDLPAGSLTHSSVRRVRIVQDEIARAMKPSGLTVEITGDAALGELLDRSAKRDIDQTTIWAFVAVTVILLVVYRSPIAMLLPLITIAASLLVSLGLIGWAASKGLPINGVVQMFVIVILVGSGVDYCLFLFARFREEIAKAPLDAGDTRFVTRRAIEKAVAQSAPTILASGGTNAVGLATLALASNRDLYTSGPTIAVAIVIATFAVLTLTPALMCAAGPRLLSRRFLRNPGSSDGRVWPFVARITTSYPIPIALVMMLVLVPPAILACRVDPLYDTFDEFPTDSSFVRGGRLYERHFCGSQGLSDVTLLLSSQQRLDTPERLAALRAALDKMAASLREQFPIVRYRDLKDPLGALRTTDSYGDASVAHRLTAALSGRIAQDYYIGQSKMVARIDVSLGVEPRSLDSMAMSRALRQAAASAVADSELAESVGGIDVHVSGEAARYADMRDLRSRDFRVIAIAAVTLIFAILVWLIRSAIQSAILIGATLLTYFCTYGTTWLIFNQVYGLEGLGWKLDFLLFIIILSLGQDYNIFVVTRIHEELRTRPPREAVKQAIRRTGGVVSSCGIIMAATFASMFAGSVMILKEFAVALSLGILIDTFIVRPLLVPSLILVAYRVGRRASDSEGWKAPTARLG